MHSRLRNNRFAQSCLCSRIAHLCLLVVTTVGGSGGPRLSSMSLGQFGFYVFLPS
jgi:hypothetical protein